MAQQTVITREFYDNLTQIWRECGPHAATVARRALCDPRTARKGYDIGWPHLGFPPIRDRLQDETIDAQKRAREAAARAAEAAAAEKERERLDRVEAARQERDMLKVARGDVLSALVIAAELTPAMRTLAKVINKAVEAPEGELPSIAPANAMALLVRHALIVQRAIGATEAIVQLSRLDRGETTAHVGVSAPEISLEDALAELEALGELGYTGRRTGGAGAPPAPRAPAALPSGPKP